MVAGTESGSPARRLVRRIRAALPVGMPLPDRVWEGRHRGILVLLWAHAIAIPVFALARGYEPSHILLESAAVPTLAAFASFRSLDRRIRTATASAGLLTSSAILVHLSGGVIEMHFHFFVMVGVVSLYHDWVPFLTAIAYVLVHHGVVGVLDPESVYNHQAALNNPWKWAGIHAFFIAGASTAALVRWRLSEVMITERAAAVEELRELYARQRTLAETLQHSLLPERLPSLPGVECAALYAAGGPGVEVGGDWYDVIQLTGGRLGIAIGDVVGRGEKAASLMGQLRNALRAYALDGKDPADLVNALNLLITDAGPEHMATMIYAVLDPARSELRFTNAGHPPLLLLEASGGVEFVASMGGLPLGAVAGTRYGEQMVKLEGGDIVVLYTDGLVEERTTSIDTGLTRLREAALGAPTDLDEMCAELVARVLQGRTSNDDMAILAVRLEVVEARLALRLPSEPGVLGPLRATLRRWLATAGATDQETFELLVACGEAATNAIRHAAGAAGGYFEVEAVVDGDVEITVRDSGHWRTPRPGIGGRGLPIIESYVDSLDLDRGEQGTTVRMRRRLVSQGMDRVSP